MNVILLAALTLATVGDRKPLEPEYPVPLREEQLLQWSFPPDLWPALHDAKVTATQGVLCITATGHDPYVRVPLPRPLPAPFTVHWRMRTAADGPAQFFWSTPEQPQMNEQQSIRVAILNDGQWHSYAVPVPATGVVTALRFDPCISTGVVEVAEAKITRTVLHPLQFETLTAIRNTATNPITVAFNNQMCTIPPGERFRYELKIATDKPFTPVIVGVQPTDLPPLIRTIYWHNPFVETDWQEFRGRNVLVRLARDRSGARLFWKGKLVAIASPLPEGLSVRLDGDEILFEVRAKPPVLGPCLRALGALEQGLLCGVEYLGKGEASSSTLDVEGPEHLRYEPDPLHVTMPLAAFVTDRGSVAMLWDNPELQPLFSTPNRYDGTDDHFMAIKGRRMTLRVRLGDSFADGARLEDAILWAVRRRGLPSLPPAPRTPEAQRALIVAAINGPLRDTNGWYHAKFGNHKPQWFADHASLLWRLTGVLPETPTLVPGGSFIQDNSAFFLSGRAEQWLRSARGHITSLIRQQQADGSFRYDGPFHRGHFENTASGYCAQHAAALLTIARYTGDQEAIAAAVKTLGFMKRFRTPRGAQVWEIPLHTPDILASAHLVRAYVLGYELTGKREYLDEARRWALSGLPFVYQWGRYPIQKYATIAVLGATNWKSPCWIGQPVQWCGTCYAYALTMLAPHDRTLDWTHLAKGILIAAEQMQWPDGPYIGCLPDYIRIPTQKRAPAPVTPCLLGTLRLRLEGELDGLAVAADEKHRVVAPFPVQLRAGKAVIRAQRGVTYQVLVNGTVTGPIHSQGTDALQLP